MVWQFLTPQLYLTISEYLNTAVVWQSLTPQLYLTIPEYRSDVVVPDAAVAGLSEA